MLSNFLKNSSPFKQVLFVLLILSLLLIQVFSQPVGGFFNSNVLNAIVWLIAMMASATIAYSIFLNALPSNESKFFLSGLSLVYVDFLHQSWNINIGLSLMFLLLALRAAYRLDVYGKRRANAFDLGLFFALSVMLVPETFVFILLYPVLFIKMKIPAMARLVLPVFGFLSGTVLAYLIYLTLGYAPGFWDQLRFDFVMPMVQQDPFKVWTLSILLGLNTLHYAYLFTTRFNLWTVAETNIMLLTVLMLFLSLGLLFTELNSERVLGTFLWIPLTFVIASYFPMIKSKLTADIIAFELMLMPVLIYFL